MLLILSGGRCATRRKAVPKNAARQSCGFSNNSKQMLYCNKKFHSSIFALRLQSFISVLDSRQLLRMSQPLPPVAPKAMMASSAFSVLNGSAQSQALPNGIPKGPKASHHSHGKAGGAKANGGGGAAAAQSVNAVHTHTAMGRWSILPKEPPSKLRLHHLFGLTAIVNHVWSSIEPDAIKAIHVYDFDNTCKENTPQLQSQRFG